MPNYSFCGALRCFYVSGFSGSKQAVAMVASLIRVAVAVAVVVGVIEVIVKSRDSYDIELRIVPVVTAVIIAVDAVVS